jgi:hypothetical protein
MNGQCCAISDSGNQKPRFLGLAIRFIGDCPKRRALIDLRVRLTRDFRLHAKAAALKRSPLFYRRMPGATTVRGVW